ncbi:hypothetical protein EDWATA_03789 [Edwardsiella tarda ATCC 23685]|uniref:Uncharacterized protein n=1 Tax=Edwardsiella tarda ATCC 23685 TaxID=500638 RepID=D4FAH0_EDWTA|nr:hypothetical protein EDWATA_03789 [Edwardsiella tarda ATCC 23685]
MKSLTYSVVDPRSPGLKEIIFVIFARVAARFPTLIIVLPRAGNTVS